MSTTTILGLALLAACALAATVIRVTTIVWNGRIAVARASRCPSCDLDAEMYRLDEDGCRRDDIDQVLADRVARGQRKASRR